MRELVIAREGHKSVTNRLTDSGRWEMVRVAERLQGRHRNGDFAVMGGSTTHVVESAFMVSEILHAPLHICPELSGDKIRNGKTSEEVWERAFDRIKKTDRDGRVIIVIAEHHMAPLLILKAGKHLKLSKKIVLPRQFDLGPGDVAVIDILNPAVSVVSSR